MIQNTRVRKLNNRELRADGAYVLYWMQEAQRPRGNAALEMAIRIANDCRLPVVVCFGLMDGYREANARHYAFMLDGLADCAAEMAARGIAFVLRLGHPADVAHHLSKDAAAVICDRSYMPAQKGWRTRLAAEAECAVTEVETEVVVPVQVVSDKSEYAARTIRPKIHRVWDEYLISLDETEPVVTANTLGIDSNVDISDPAALLETLDLDRSAIPVKRFRGGWKEARRRLRDFLDHALDGYAEGRNEPCAGQTSFLSAYLHFGHISPVEAALAVREADTGTVEDRTAYIEELIVRRELAMNYAEFEPLFETYAAIPGWAQKTLAEHAGDPREYVYGIGTLEACDTHDAYWNTGMREMVHTGYMHNYMRMYWAKKILEWSATPQIAFDTTVTLNNKYFLDGRDPNSYANIAWCYGLHDRAWAERPIFGKIRYMNANGLNRKFDMDAYAAAVKEMVAAESA